MTTEPKWTATNMNRQAGATTFKTCGWCEHRGCGSYRYSCMLSGGCDLLEKYGDRVDVQWNTKCKVVNLGPGDIKTLIQAKQSTIDSARQTITRNEKLIVALENVSVPYRPCLTDNRQCTHFPNGSSIYVWHEGKYNHGTVVPGFRSGDGCVSYVLDDYPDSEGGWGGGFRGPWVITEAEYRYFKRCPTTFETWMKQSDRTYNGEKLDIQAYIDYMRG